jgi:DNA-binding transcriptional MerR regulator
LNGGCGALPEVQQRTEGGTRRYSGRDIDRINQIATLLASGLNLAASSRFSLSKPRPTVSASR